MKIPGATSRSDLLMTQGWQLLEKAFERGDPAEIAFTMGVSIDTVHRWARRPLTTDDPNATGRGNPIDYFLRLLFAVYLANPDGAQTVARGVVAEIDRLDAIHGHAELQAGKKK